MRETAILRTTASTHAREIASRMGVLKNTVTGHPSQRDAGRRFRSLGCMARGSQHVTNVDGDAVCLATSWGGVRRVRGSGKRGWWKLRGPADGAGVGWVSLDSQNSSGAVGHPSRVSPTTRAELDEHIRVHCGPMPPTGPGGADAWRVVVALPRAMR